MASKAVLEKKANVVSEIIDKVKNANSVILFDYLGLSAEEVAELRRLLRDNSSDYKVYKNTLTKRAMDELKIDIDEFLSGPSAIAFSNDVVSPAKVLSDFAKKHKALEIKVGYIDGKVADKVTIGELASIPSREGLLTMLAGGMIQYLKDLSVSLNLLAEKLDEGNDKPEETKESIVEEQHEEKVEEISEETTEEVVEESTEEITEEVVEEQPEEENKEEEKEE